MDMIEKAVDYAVFGIWLFKQKLSDLRQQGTAAFAFIGGQGDMPSASQFLQVSTWKKPAEMVPMS